MQTLKPTDVIDGRYEVVEILGSGSFGTVYKARQTQIDRLVAVKVLSSAVDSPEENARFEREAKAISVLQHKNIVSFYGFGFWHGAPYMVTELAQGLSLLDVLYRQPQLDRTRCIRIFFQVLDALSAAHKQGIIHRDLKPSNIMLVREPDGSESVKIIDFGLAKLLPGYGVPSQKLTETGFAIGTCQYMSPEQCTGGIVDGRADLYSAGCIFYQCLTGAVPFDAVDAVEIMYQHLNVTPKPLRTYLPDDATTAGLQNFCDNCLAKDPDMRYASAEEALRDMNAISSGQSAKVKVFGTTTSSHRRAAIPKKAERPRWVLPMLALASAILVGTAYYMQAPNTVNKPAPVATPFPQVIPADIDVGTEEMEYARRVWKDLKADLGEDAKNHNLSASQRSKMAYLLAKFYDDKGDLQQAEQYAQLGWDQASKATRYPERARNILVGVSIKLGKFNKADQLARSVFKEDVKSQVHVVRQLAHEYSQVNRLDRARTVLESVLGIPGLDPLVRKFTYYHLGDICLANERKREAEAFYRRGVESDKAEDAVANPNWLGLARMALLEHNAQAAHEYLRNVQSTIFGDTKSGAFPRYNAVLLLIADAAHQRERQVLDSLVPEFDRVHGHAWNSMSAIVELDDTLAVRALKRGGYDDLLDRFELVFKHHRSWNAQRRDRGKLHPVD